MKAVVIDQALRAKLNGDCEPAQLPVDLCDETGKLVGHFVEPELFRRMCYALAEAACPYSEEQLQRFQQEKGGRPLQEIWKDLDKE